MARYAKPADGDGLTQSNALLADLEREIVGCRSCERLVRWREQVAVERRAAYADQQYWGRPVPGFGDPGARVLILGLAPAAHGANRTGRMFTGDRSGDWLFGSLWRTGFANQPDSQSRKDGLELSGAWVTAAVRCAPPANRPTTAERDSCLAFAERELALLCEVRVVVCLGGFAWDAALALLRSRGATLPRPRPRFAHGARAEVGGLTLLGTYHPSQQNTFTKRLTEPMLDGVMRQARDLAFPT